MIGAAKYKKHGAMKKSIRTLVYTEYVEQVIFKLKSQ